MSDTQHTSPRLAPEQNRLDRPGDPMPSIDRPWEDMDRERAHRLEARSGDRAAHRMHHALYEDMLN